MPSRLSNSDFDIIARARALADAHGTGALRTIAGSDPDLDWAMVRVEALGVAQHLLAELADRLERLGGA